MEAYVMGAHRCNICGKVKDDRLFNQRKNGERIRCRTCEKEKKLIRAYGITKQQYNILHKKQRGRCLICMEKADPLVVDHDHQTNLVRGLLCHSCNLVLGKMRDNINLFCMAITYLNNAREAR